MNHKQKLGYMGLGAGILAVGIIIGQVITPNIEAQSNGVFDEITCRKLTVVDKTGKMIAFLGRGVSFPNIPGGGIESNGFKIFDEDGQPAITLSANITNEVTIHDNTGGSAIRLHSLGGGSRGGFSTIQVFEGGDKGFDLSISDGFRSMTVYDPLETTDIEIRGHKVTTWKEAFKVNVSNTRNALQLWGKSPYQKGIGFYGDSNEAKQTTWIPEQEE